MDACKELRQTCVRLTDSPLGLENAKVEVLGLDPLHRDDLADPLQIAERIYRVQLLHRCRVNVAATQLH